MSERDEARPLAGPVEIDDAYPGGERPDKRGRGSMNKIPFVGAVQTSKDGHSLCARLSRLPVFTKEALEAWASKALVSSAQVLADGLDCVRASPTPSPATNRPTSARGLRPSSILSFATSTPCSGSSRRRIAGTYHAFEFAKYGDRYLAEVRYRFNRRFDLRAILARLLRAAATTPPRGPSRRIRMA